MTGIDEFRNDGRADEACRAGNKDVHQIPSSEPGTAKAPLHAGHRVVATGRNLKKMMNQKGSRLNVCSP